MKIEIPFNDWSKKRLRQGKIATSRNNRYGNPGDTFTVDDRNYKLVLVRKLPLWFIRDCLWGCEGALSPHEFVHVWCEIHKQKGWKDNQEVWFHMFDRVIVQDTDI